MVKITIIKLELFINTNVHLLLISANYQCKKNFMFQNIINIITKYHFSLTKMWDRANLSTARNKTE